MQLNIRGVLRGQIDDHTYQNNHIEEQKEKQRQLDREEKERIKLEKIQRNLGQAAVAEGAQGGGSDVIKPFLPLMPTAIT